MGSAQSVHDIIKEQDEQQRLEEWNKASTTTAAPPVFHDEADLSVTNDVSHESSDVHLDQSNHGFSFINLHWASFSTGLSSVLAVIISLALIAGFCYVRGRRQRQSRARHVELLHTIVHGVTKAVSTATYQQSGAYPGPAPSVQPAAVHCLPLQTTDLSSSLLSFLPEAPPCIPSSATHRAHPPYAVSRAAPPPMAAVRLPNSLPLTPATSSPTRTIAPLRSFPLPSNSFPRRGPPASTPSAVDSRTLTPAHSVQDYNTAAAFSSAPPGSVPNLKVRF